MRSAQQHRRCWASFPTTYQETFMKTITRSSKTNEVAKLEGRREQGAPEVDQEQPIGHPRRPSQLPPGRSRRFDGYGEEAVIAVHSTSWDGADYLTEWGRPDHGR